MMKRAGYYLASFMLIVGAGQRLWAQADDPALVRTFRGHKDMANSVAFSPDGRYALSGSNDETLKLWEVSSGMEVRTFRGHSGGVYAVAFSPDGRYALSGGFDDLLILWDVFSDREIRTFVGHSSSVLSVAFSPDGQNALSGSRDRFLKLWEVSTGSLVHTFQRHSAFVHSVAFSPDGRYALSGIRNSVIKLWEISSGLQIRTFEGHTNWVSSVDFSQDGLYALSGSWDNTLKLWEVSSGREIRAFEGHSGGVCSVAFSSTGRYALSGSMDNTIKLWDVASGRELRTFRGHSRDGIRSVAFSPDDRYALSAGGDKTIKLWDLTAPAKPASNMLAKVVTPTLEPTTKISTKADHSPPTIQITSPVIARGMKKVQPEKTILVKGKATDKSGIFEVLVNDVEATLVADGGFWAEVKLRVGENKIYVKATDIHGNAAGVPFTVVRETEAGPPPEVAEQPADFQFGEYHALLIAVEDYADGSINDLDYPIGDATTLRRVLLDKYTFNEGNIHLLKNPDRQAILGKFGELRRSLEPNDNLLVFYAGHGYWDADLRQGYWLPRDAQQSDQAAWISNSDIRDQVRGLKTRHTLLISDACFSGGIFRTREAFLLPDMAVQKVYELPSRKALTSGNLKTVPDRSVFAEYLVKRLEQNREPYLYSEKLYLQMRDAVTNNSPNNQTPLFGVVNGAGDEGGDFIFVRK